MKILFLTRRFYPDIGGVEKHVLEVTKELIKRGHKITIIAESSTPKAVLRARPAFGGASNYHLKDQSDTYSINSREAVKSIQNDTFEFEKPRIFRVNFGKNDWTKKIRIWLKLVSYIRILKDSDIVHCHDVFFWYLPFRFLFPTKKVFTTFHGYETKFPPGIKAKLVRKISEKLSYGNICIGDFIIKWYGTKPDYVTYGGIESQKSPPKADGPLAQKLRRKKLDILLLGRLEEDNGAKVYLDTLKELKRKSISYRLTVCGDGKFRRQFEKYGDVKGFVPDLNKYIDRADFIFASSYLSIFEGLVRSKNVFCAFQNDLKEDYLKLSPFKDYISISGNSNSLVDQLLHIIDNTDEAYNTQKKAQKWVEKQTWPKVADLYLKLWNL